MFGYKISKTYWIVYLMFVIFKKKNWKLLLLTYALLNTFNRYLTNKNQIQSYKLLAVCSCWWNNNTENVFNKFKVLSIVTVKLYYLEVYSINRLVFVLVKISKCESLFFGLLVAWL